MNRRRATIGLVSAAGALLGLIVVGGGLTYAGQLLPAPSRDRTPDITARRTGQGTVVLPAERRACLETFGLLMEGGFLRYGGEVQGSCDGAGTVERTIVGIDEGDPAVDVELAARFDEYIYALGPEQVGLAPRDVVVSTEQGPAEAWFLPGQDDGDVWAILVHGRSALRDEALRVLPTVVESGLPSLVITYRNDFAGGPPGVDDTGRFGQAEWPDLAAAVDHARAQGAQEVVLIGFSQGGSLIGYYLRNAGEEGVAGIILDAPLLDLSSTLVQQARNRDIPGPLIPPILLGTRVIANLRSGFDVGDVDHVQTFIDSRVPLLLIHGVQDDFVPIEPSDAVAAGREDGLTYERFPDAGHVEAFNSDPDRYTDVVRIFLDRVAG